MTQPAFGLFSLFATFDVIGVFAVYIICLQLMGRPIKQSLEEDVLNYYFESSLFDCVVNAAYRTLQLLFVHTVYRSTSIFSVGLTTTITTAFTIAKVFLYKYPYDENETFVYILIFSNLLVAWVELWLFVAFIYNPHHALQHAHLRAASVVTAGSGELGSDYRRNRGNFGYGATVSERFFSAAGSDDGGTIASHSRNKLASLKEDEEIIDESDRILLSCQETCIRLTDEIFRLAYSPDVQWKSLSGFDDCASVCTGSSDVVSPEFRIGAPIFRVVIDLDVRFDVLKRVLVDEIIKMPEWHPFVPQSKLIERMDTRRLPGSPYIEVTYQTSQPALGGFVSSRDFVNLRHVGFRDGIAYSVSMGTAHQQCPPQQGYVRGETGPCCYMLVSQNSPYLNDIIPQPPHSTALTRFVWIVNTDVKGGLPGTIVNRAMHYALRRFISDLRSHLVNLKTGEVSSPSSDDHLIDLTD